MTSADKLEHIKTAVDEMKAEQIEVLDVRQKTSVADYFIVCGGTSDRHVASIADKATEKLKLIGERPLRTEGEGSGWVLLDFGDVILHVMREEQRQFYDLETLWKTMQRDPSLES